VALTEVDRLSAGKYLLLTTFRKDGTAVATPVWVARDGDRLVAWSAANAGKVKRIRRDGRVELAPCDVRGTPTGPAVPGRARLLDEAGTADAKRLIVRRFPLTGRLVQLGSTVRRGPNGSVGIEIEPISD
jgi:PPOX class probable F420-dependent enzyme